MVFIRLRPPAPGAFCTTTVGLPGICLGKRTAIILAHSSFSPPGPNPTRDIDGFSFETVRLLGRYGHGPNANGSGGDQRESQYGLHGHLETLAQRQSAG